MLQQPISCFSLVQLVPICFIYVAGGVEGMFLIKELWVIMSLLITNRKSYLGSPTIRFDFGGLDCRGRYATHIANISERNTAYYWTPKGSHDVEFIYIIRFYLERPWNVKVTRIVSGKKSVKHTRLYRYSGNREWNIPQKNVHGRGWALFPLSQCFLFFFSF